MTRRCELLGTLPLSGQRKSHAENKTKRKFRPNLCNVTFISDALGRNVRLRVSTNAIKSVDHRGGFDAFLIKEGHDAQAALASLHDFNATYQAAADGRLPRFRAAPPAREAAGG